jgi:hypothetical protein
MVFDYRIAILEYREWERQFNKRAARGEFIPRAQESEVTQSRRWWAQPLEQLRGIVRDALPRAA